MSALTHFVLWSLHLVSARTMYTAEEHACLERHAAGRRRLVEIGCWHGVNTRRLRRVMAPGAALFGVDPYPPGRLGFSAQRLIARGEVNQEANGSIRWLRMTDVAAAGWFRASREAPVDFVFSDSLNTVEGFRATWETWSPLVAAGGRYVLANSRSSATKQIEAAGSVQYTRDVILRDPRFRLVDEAGTFTVLERL